MSTIRAILADDEEALRSYLKKKLSTLWPDLAVVGEARDGDAALELIHGEKPDIAFLDISMPGLSGLEVAAKAGAICLVVFVTAHNEYAIEAFERSAVDYILKPVTDERLAKTVARLKERLAQKTLPDLSGVLEKLAQAPKREAKLEWVKAQHKDGIVLIPVSDILYFKSTDKYTTVRTREQEVLIRKPLKELEDQLDPERFWRVHRGALVNVRFIHAVKRSIAGTLEIRFKDITDRLAISRAFTHLFKQM